MEAIPENEDKQLKFFKQRFSVSKAFIESEKGIVRNDHIRELQNLIGSLFVDDTIAALELYSGPPLTLLSSLKIKAPIYVKRLYELMDLFSNDSCSLDLALHTCEQFGMYYSHIVHLRVMDSITHHLEEVRKYVNLSIHLFLMKANASFDTVTFDIMRRRLFNLKDDGSDNGGEIPDISPDDLPGGGIGINPFGSEWQIIDTTPGFRVEKIDPKPTKVKASSEQ